MTTSLSEQPWEGSTAKTSGRASMAPAIEGARAIAPAIAALLPVALALGASVGASPIDDRAGFLGAPLVYAASAHATAVAMLGNGASGFAILLTVFVLTARGVVYSVGIVSRMESQPAWFRWAGPYFLVDPLYLVVTARAPDEDTPSSFRRYYLGAGLALWFMWVPAVAIGILLGPLLPRSDAIGFALPALLVAFLITGLRSRPAVAAALAGGAVASAGLLPGGANLIAGAALGVAAGLAAERRAP